MADRSITVKIGAQVAGLQAGLRTASTQLKSFNSQLVNSAQNNRQAWDQAGMALTGFGAVATAGFASTIKAAMDWESAWTGVTKTVEGTPAQLSKVEDGLRGLARTLPASHAEIAGVAEAAGQLGISTDSVVGFTKTMIDLGETTNLTADQAATSLARFSNIMGTSEGNIDNLGSAIVGLGNNFATTESEITEMSLRIAGAGKQAGLSEGDVLGLSTALSSVGIEAESGGTAISTTMTKIGTAVDTNSDKLDTFAQVAGMSAEQFSTAWEDDAGSALTAFITGLGDTEKMGMSTNQVLSQLGITGIREADALRRLSASQGTLTEAMAMGNAEYEKNEALSTEAEKRYATSEAKVQMAANAIRDAAIDIGAAFLPIVATGAEAVGKLASAFSDLPGPVKTAAGALGGLVGVGSLVAGGLLLVVPRVIETVNAFKTLSTTMPGVTGKLKSFGGVVGKLGIAGAVVGIGVALDDAFQNAGVVSADVDKLSGALERLGQTGSSADMAALNEMMSGKSSGWDFAKFAGDQADAINGLGDSLVRMQQNVDEGWFDHTLGWSQSGNDFLGGTAAWKQAEENVKTLDQAMADAASSGNSEALAGAQQALATAAADAGLTIQEAKAHFPEYTAALADNTTAAEQNANTGLEAAQSTLGGVMGDTTANANEQAAAMDALRTAQNELAAASLAVGDSQIALEKSFDDARAAVKKNGATLDITTEKGRNNKTALLDIANASLKAAEDMRKLGASDKEIADSQGRSRRQFIKTAQQMGATKKQAKAMADEFGLIKDVDIEVDANTAPARKEGESAKKYISRLKSIIEVDGDTVPARKKGESAEDYISRLKSVIDINGNNADAKSKGKDAQNDINGRDATIDVKADTSSARATWSSFFSSIQGKVATVRANVIRTIQERTVKKKAAGGAIYGPGNGLSDSVPAMLSNGEHVLTSRDVRAMGGQSGVYAFRSALHTGQAEGFAGGGAVGSATRALRSARRKRNATASQLRRARAALRRAEKTKKESDDRAAQKRVNALEKAYEKRQRQAQAQADRLQRLREEASDTRVDVRRGNLRSEARSGLSGAYSVVDQMRELAGSGDLTRRQSRRLSRSAGYSEKRMRSLYKRAADLEKRLDKAKTKFEDLLSIRDSVKSGLVGGFSLGQVTNPWTGTSAGTTGKDYLASTQAYAAQMKTFAGKLKALQKKGYPGAILQEVAAMGPEAGIPAADALLSLNTKDTNALKSAYSSIGSYATQAGNTVTEGFYKGGVLAAKGLVKGLESQQKNVNSAIARMAKAMEKALKKALGIKSPSTVFRDLGLQTGAGMVVGLEASVPAVTKASEHLAYVPSAVAPSVYANPPRAGATNAIAVVDKGAMADAMNGVKMTLLVDGKPIEAIAQTTVDRNLAATATSLRGGRR